MLAFSGSSFPGSPGLAQSSSPTPAQSSADSSFAQLSADADAARKAGNITRAADLYTQAVSLNPSWPDGWWYLGQMNYSVNNYKAAIDAFSRYLTLVPNAAPATALRGLCEFELADYPSSLRDVQRALALGAADDSRNTQILRYHQGLLLTKLGRYEQALDSYRWFARQHFSSQDLMVAIGLAALRLPLLPQEADAAQTATSADAGNAVFLLLSGDNSAAAQAFAAFFERYPAAPNVHYTWGYLLYPTDPDAAISRFQQELSADPANAIDRSMLAWALLMDNSPAEALPEAKKAAEEAPTLPMAQLSLGRALLETGDAKSATQVLEKALPLDPQNLEIHLALARAYSETGREQDARRERLACLAMTEPSSKPAPAMGQQGAPPAN
ncbi:MAG TPA: tetratricopeptide repeat protein [Acidobacteriaceae bacterium]|jgi:tetratricopeptide (TPR) repeat protein|nr:tetratricopeptide repeat protein [Acidobacteriaceae bacterium]